MNPLKLLAAAILAVLMPWVAWAQDSADTRLASERARIAAEKGEANARFSRDEAACYAKFAASDCLNEASARRREALADLRRQEISLNDEERKRKAAAQRQRLDQRAEEQEARQVRAQERAQAARTSAEDRAARKAGRAPASQAVPASAPASAGRATPATVRSARDEEEARRAHEARVKEAEQRKERVLRRQQDKPAAKPLPVPP